jgi:hypothetical protein
MGGEWRRGLRAAPLLGRRRRRRRYFRRLSAHAQRRGGGGKISQLARVASNFGVVQARRVRAWIGKRCYFRTPKGAAANVEAI